ncbi:MAG: preprotein translocase subunit SecA [Flavobacteriales bacterium]
MAAIEKIFTALFGKKSDRDIKEIMPLVEQTKVEYAKLSPLSNDQLRAKTTELKKRIAERYAAEEKQIEELKKASEEIGLSVEEKEKNYAAIDALVKKIDEKIEEVLLEILPEAFAVVKDTARRFTENEEVEVTANDFDREVATRKDNLEIEGDKAIYFNSWTAGGNEIKWDMIHYDVQLIGGINLHKGKISEMSTGEGKTLVATLPVYLNALAGKGVHLVTVNDYLAKRDCEWMAPLFEFHGLSIDCIDRYESHSEGRKKAYRSDITYGTNNEFGFDYLRDNMSTSLDQLVQRKHHFAIVDEVDSVLIDDARTPLIISGATRQKQNLQFNELKPFVEKLVTAQKAYVTKALADAKKLLTEGNKDEGGVALLRAHRGLPKNKALIKFLSEPGIKQQLQKTENFHMQEQGKQMRVADSELYFVIDEKHNSIELTEKGIDHLAQFVEDRDFFVMTDLGSEVAKIESSSLSDKEKRAAKEAYIKDYGVKADRIHTMNQLLKAYTLFEKDVEYVIIDNQVKIVDEQTGRIMDGRRWSDGLHQAVEAKENVKIEATTQTHASITLQNYFRMYHKLAGMTGTAETEAQELWDIYNLDVTTIPTNRPVTRKDMEDKVYKTQREKYNAVIEEIAEITKAGRPVLVGTTSVEISELLSRMLQMRGIKHNTLNAKRHQQEAQIVKEAGQSAMVTIATNMAGRGTDIKLSEEVRKAGGLAIIGTERHDSRRVDRQLRGRSGRQGDPGTSQFFVSLEDPLMRRFGSERIARIMDRMGYKEGEVIQAGMITKSIERAQKKVEENNFGIRKRLLEYDNVMNAQREVIYKRRRNALNGERLSVDISNLLLDITESVIAGYHDIKDYEGFRMEMIRVFAIESPFSQEEFQSMKSEDLFAKLSALVLKTYEEKTERLRNQAWPVVKNVYETQGQQFTNIAIPFSTNGQNVFQIAVNLRKAYETQGKEIRNAFEKNIVLFNIDEAWREHLREMDDLRNNVQNAAIEQKDPLLIYKFESFNIFKQMVNKMNADIGAFLFRAEIMQGNGGQQPQVREAAREELPDKNLKTSHQDAAELDRAPAKPKQEPIKAEVKVGRNDPCPCGSGKKYKQCHGKMEVA